MEEKMETYENCYVHENGITIIELEPSPRTTELREPKKVSLSSLDLELDIRDMH